MRGNCVSAVLDHLLLPDANFGDDVPDLFLLIVHRVKEHLVQKREGLLEVVLGEFCMNGEA